VDPAGEVKPDGQLIQLEAPAAEYVLAAHCAHEVEVVPKLVLYWPAGQEKAVPQPPGQLEGEPIVPVLGQKEKDVAAADVL
jgi:hypothetical protein